MLRNFVKYFFDKKVKLLSSQTLNKDSCDQAKHNPDNYTAVQNETDCEKCNGIVVDQVPKSGEDCGDPEAGLVHLEVPVLDLEVSPSDGSDGTDLAGRFLFKSGGS